MGEKYPAIMIEVPHQTPPTVYVVGSRAALVAVCDREAGDNWEWETEDPKQRPLEEWLDAWGHDFHYARVLFGEEEAVAFLGKCESPQHQGVRVTTLVRWVCADLGWWLHDEEEIG
jgi:hypothetical protein